MVQKLKLTPGKFRTQEVKTKNPKKPSLPSITSSADDLEPSVNLGFVFQNDLLDLNKKKNGTKEDYFKDHEKHLAKLFGIKPRASSSDTRPDLYLTSSQIDNLLQSKYDTSNINIIESSTPDFNRINTSAIKLLREKLRAFEQSKLLEGLPSESSGTEIKGSQYGYEPKGDFRKSTAFTSREIVRTTPRSLSGRTLLSAYDGKTPAKGSEVISLAAAIVGTFEEVKKNLLPSKDYRQLDYRSRLEKDKEAATDIYNFLKKGDNLSNLHKAMTGYAQSDKLMTQLANTPAARQVKSKGEQLFMQYVVEDTVQNGNNFSQKKTSYTAYLYETFKYENTKVELSATSINFSYTNKYEKAVMEKVNKLLTKELDASLSRNLSNTLLKESELGQLLGTVIGVADSSGKINFQFKADVSGSMPIGKIKIPNYTVKRKSSGSAFQSRIGSIRSLLQETRVETPSMGDFVTDDTITALTKREMLRRMPIGPVGGPPKSSRVLTYRTGRFVNSLQVIADMRSMAVQYYYDPRYWIHEATSRNPRNLIDSSINSVTRSLFGKRFNLIKANQSL